MRTVVTLLVILVLPAAILSGGLRLASMSREVGVLPVRIPEEGRIVESRLGPVYPKMRKLVISATLTKPMATGPVVRWFLHRQDAATPELVDVPDRPKRRAGTTAGAVGWIPGRIVAPPAALSARPDAWAALGLPLALIWGDRDTATLPAAARTMANPTGAPLSILPEVGQIPQIEAPTGFQAALIAALADMAPPNTPPNTPPHTP
jgi:pimeloyl-ACP methyl ester carboxylesterase